MIIVIIIMLLLLLLLILILLLILLLLLLLVYLCYCCYYYCFYNYCCYNHNPSPDRYDTHMTSPSTWICLQPGKQNNDKIINIIISTIIVIILEK